MTAGPPEAPRSLRLSPLCAICDADVCARMGWTVTDLAAACLRGGATFLQIRAKALPGRDLLRVAREVVELARGRGALVVVNDRPDIGRLAGAGGVHVGQDDLSPEDARVVVGEAAVVGVSTHTPGQLAAALAGPADYVAIGPVFGTRTKDTGYHALGLEAVRTAAIETKAAARPLVAIGGITLDAAASVIAAGADSVAVIGDLLSTGDPESRVRAYLERLGAR